MRSDVREGVQIYIMSDIKPNFTHLAKQFDCDPKTVKRYYEEDFSLRKKERKKRSSKLDPFRSIIQEKVALGCSAAAIYSFIKKKGYQGKDSILREYCSQLRETHIQKATIRVETQPGLSAQVDWKEELVLYNRSGERFQINLFLYVLGFSRWKFIELTLDRKQDTLFQCLNNAFIASEGVPQEIWFDNMRTVVNQSRTQFRKVTWNQRFYEYSKDARFKPISCRPYRPQTKGKVEALARTVDRLNVYNGEFDTLDDLIDLVFEFNEELNKESSQAIDCPPIFRFNAYEKEHLSPFGSKLLMTYTQDALLRKVSKESLVIFQKNKYSVPVRYIGKIVSLQNVAGELTIYYNGECIQRHSLSKRKFNYTPEDMQEILKSDIYRSKSDEEIAQYVQENLKLYDDFY
ncbi:IS21 family transposase [Listeria monocytogenes]|nr:IS21 family transposase [Listeria monocytogenes]EAC7083908.1 IS21 family transposase [Listeria monocytogenes]EAD0622391.1 IS21 family transposase [Listeria monocytogenes]EAD8590490.1 IS21 family transposase [Listeria monocytogenes]EAD8591633.1 IS21 family transposase [Listeria monocytogenes]